MSNPTSLTSVIFDMDGVLIDSELHWKKLEGFFLQSLVGEWQAKDQDRIIGLSVHDLYSMLVAEYGLTKEKESFLALYNEMAREIYTQHISLIEPFPQLLTELKRHNIPTALASSSPHAWIMMALDRFSLHPFFKVVISSDELSGKGKPAPDIYLLTAQRMDIKPSECLVIEDSKNGALSAKAAGMYCIGIRNGFNDEQDLSAANEIKEGAEQVCVRIRELLAL